MLSKGLLISSIVDEDMPTRPLLGKVMECAFLAMETSDESIFVSVTMVFTLRAQYKHPVYVCIQMIQAASIHFPICGLQGTALATAFKIIFKIHVHSKPNTRIYSLSKATLSHVLTGPFRVLRTVRYPSFHLLIVTKICYSIQHPHLHLLLPRM